MPSNNDRDILTAEEKRHFLYCQTVLSAEDYDENDVRSLIGVLNDEERILLSEYLRKYLKTPLPCDSRRSRNDRIVFAIAEIIENAAKVSADRLAIKPKPIFSF